MVGERPKPSQCLLCQGERVSFYLEDPLPWGWSKLIYRCADCGGGFVFPMPSREQIQQFYDSSYFSKREESGFGYTEYDSEGVFLSRFFNDMLNHLQRLVQKGRLLDVGCADGAFLERARARGFEGEGVEMALWAVEKARERGLVVWQGAFEEVSAHLPEEHYDVITLLDVLEHVPCPKGFLRGVWRLLKKGGWVFIHTPNYEGSGLRFKSEALLTKSREHLLYFTPRSLTALLQKEGFQKVKVGTRPPGLPVRALRDPQTSRLMKIGKLLTWVYKRWIITPWFPLNWQSMYAWGQKEVT
jgi:2-polyprenyl-3-methyl-5-hydroxy-6-metoxy-1,4-benzoquinol methylase